MHVTNSLSEIEPFSLVNSQNSIDYERSARLALFKDRQYLGKCLLYLAVFSFQRHSLSVSLSDRVE
jgi:hypothetical protein